jgi:hypothetical protein
METHSESRMHEDAERAQRPYASLIRARERVRRVLEPHLGADHALERANNITQALVFDDAEPAFVAREMLRHVPSAQRCLLAEAVSRAFGAHDDDMCS